MAHDLTEFYAKQKRQLDLIESTGVAMPDWGEDEAGIMCALGWRHGFEAGYKAAKANITLDEALTAQRKADF